MEETSPLMEKVEAKKRGEEKVGVVGEVDMVLILHEKVAIKMGSENTFVFWKQKQCTTHHHHHSPRSPFFYVFLFVCFCFYCFSKQEMMLLFGACMYQLNIPSSHHPSYIIITSKTSASKRKRERSVDAWRFWRVMLGFWDATGFTSNHPLNLHLSTSPLSFLRFLFFSFLFFPFLFLSFLVVKSSVTVVTIRSQKIPPPSSPVSAMMVTSFSWALQFQLDVIASLNKKKKSINIKNIYIFVPNWHSSWGKLNSTALWVFNYFIFRIM